MTAIGEELYEGLGPWYRADQQSPGQPLRDFAEANIGGLAPIEEVIRDTPDGPGWSIVMDPDRAPLTWLPWLSNFGGGRLPDGLTEQQMRDHIKGAPAFRRGGPAAIIQATQAHLTGNKTVFLRERDGSAYRLSIATFESETPNPDVTLADILTQKPAGIVLNYFTTTGSDYGILLAAHTDYSDVLSTFATYADVFINPGA